MSTKSLLLPPNIFQNSHCLKKYLGYFLNQYLRFHSPLHSRFCFGYQLSSKLTPLCLGRNGRHPRLLASIIIGHVQCIEVDASTSRANPHGGRNSESVFDVGHGESHRFYDRPFACSLHCWQASLDPDFFVAFKISLN